MPKVDFTNKIDEFEKWLNNKAEPSHYMVYATDEKIIIMRPTKSTPTYDYTTIMFQTKNAMEQVALKLEELGYFVSKPTKFVWDIDRIENYK